MASGDSKVTVRIEGNADDLSRELKESDRALGRFGTKAQTAGVAAAAGLVVAGAAAIEFGQTALAEADRTGDAVARLQLQLGGLSDELIETADDFTHLGQSKQDILELEARIADVATALGIADPLIATFADEAAATAAAIELLGGADAATNVDLIGKAAGGSVKAMKELGIAIDEDDVIARAVEMFGKVADELSEGEINAARYQIVLEKLKPKLDEVASGQGDVEQSTAELQAKWETFTGVVGETIEGPLNEALGWTLDMVDALGDLAAALAFLEGPMTAVGVWADDMKGNFQEALGPIQGLIDLAVTLIGLTNPLLRFTGLLDTASEGAGNFRGQVPSAPGGGGRPSVNINVQPRDGADTERAVVNALRDWERKNGSGR